MGYLSDAKGITRVERVCRDASVYIYSLSHTLEVQRFKQNTLEAATGVLSERYILPLGHEKLAIQADVVVEDCLENLLGYSDGVVKILITKSYNQQSASEDTRLGIVRVRDLLEAIEEVEKLALKTRV